MALKGLLNVIILFFIVDVKKLRVGRLIEELVPFLDHDIHDPAALQLGSHLKRKHRSSPPPKVTCYSQRLLFALLLLFV